MIYNKYH